MYEYNYLNVHNMKNACRACLRTGDDVRVMTVEEVNAYHQFAEGTAMTASLYVCVYCGHLLKKLRKFVFQCQEANQAISSFLQEDTKYQVYIPPLRLTYNLTITSPQTLDIQEHEFPSPMSDDDVMFDDDDVPLVMLKKEEGVGGRVKKKKKKVKNREFKEEVIKVEAIQMEQPQESQNSCEVKGKNLKPKKPLREGFSSRMVQETDEYIVIKLTKEQVLQEMQTRSNSEEYQRARYKCSLCVKGFNFEDVLETHMKKHTVENGSLQCDICTQHCPSAVSLRGHMKSHTTRYKCKVCGCSRLSRQHLLEHHAAAHTRRAPRLACRHCAFSTVKRTSMQRHVKSHRLTEQHACHQCGKLFKSLQTLRVHTLRHDKSKRLQCDACGRVFIYPSLLHRHVQAVHVRKDYYCVECDAQFKSPENLKLHFKKAKKHRDATSYQHECTECPERFASAGALAAHVTHAHGARRRHACAACRRRYSSRDALRAHARAKHAGNDKVEITLMSDDDQPPLLETQEV